MTPNRVDATAPELFRAEPARHSLLRNTAAVGLGAALVAVAAQVSVPIPFTPVPMTLQPMAVIIVGGLLGPMAGAAALVTYLAMGIAGLPVFAAIPGAPQGVARLLGPTGGYLLSYPLVAAVTGWLATVGGRTSADVVRVMVACVIGMVLVHVGGASQLALLTGSAAGAFKLGFVPFLTGDLIKVGLAAAVILLAGPRVRSWL